MLSSEALRRWCRGKIKVGAVGRVNDRHGEFCFRAFVRSVAWESRDLRRWLKEGDTIPLRVQRLMSRFVADWDAGRIAFTPYAVFKPRRLVHVERPRPRNRLSVAIGAAGPKLSLEPRHEREAPMPTFRDLI